MSAAIRPSIVASVVLGPGVKRSRSVPEVGPENWTGR